MPSFASRPGGNSRPSHPSIGGKGLRLSQQTKRHRKIPKDNIRAITKGDIRRLARRGGVKRISAVIYDDARDCIKSFLTGVLHDCVTILESSASKRRTITVTDVIFALKRRSRPIYGFDKETYTEVKRRAMAT